MCFLLWWMRLKKVQKAHRPKPECASKKVQKAHRPNTPKNEFGRCVFCIVFEAHPGFGRCAFCTFLRRIQHTNKHIKPTNSKHLLSGEVLFVLYVLFLRRIQERGSVADVLFVLKVLCVTETCFLSRLLLSHISFVKHSFCQTPLLSHPFSVTESTLAQKVHQPHTPFSWMRLKKST